MKFIVFDLEATCWEDRNNGKISEIIEIGAVAVDLNGEVVGEFAEFIKPQIHPDLSDFCKKLTTIRQEEVETAASFAEVIMDFQRWIGIGINDYLLCSWGFYDRKQLSKDCELHQLEASWLVPHISLKHQYQKIKQLKKAVGMGRALRLEGLPLEGTHHRGIDDARNITKIFLKHLKKWEKSQTHL